jgi:nicotinamide-nucleotide amidase
MNAIIISVGDELVLGQTVDTNSAWLSRQLAAAGCAVSAHLTVPDDQRAIERAIRESIGSCDYLIISGGIGPTEDDLTRQALAGVMGVPLEMNERWLGQLREFFEKRGRPMPERNRIQAMIPRGAEMIWNHAGTASGIRATIDEELIAIAAMDDLYFHIGTTADDRKSQIANHRCEVFVLPGVPKEMMLMFQRDVLPHIERRGGGACILSRTLHTFGMGESAIAEKLGELMTRGRNPSVGTTVSGGQVSLRINARFQSRAEAEAQVAAAVAACHERLGDLIFGEEDQTLQEAVATLLRERRKTVVTAESCTGGLLAKFLTDVPGSSAYFTGGWVTYANEVKAAQLGVSPALIEQDGAVSEAVVTELAQRALGRSGADHALAISGIAGPDGGTADKPVGTVWIARAARAEQKSEARRFLFPGDREMIRDRAAKMALAMLRYHLLGRPMPF